MVGEEDDLIHFWQEWKFTHSPRQFGQYVKLYILFLRIYLRDLKMCEEVIY